MRKSVVRHIINTTKTIKWWVIVAVVLLSLVLSWPLLGNSPFPFKKFLKLSPLKTNIPASDLPRELPLEGVGDTMGSKNFFSSLFNIKTNSMPVELCLSNKNKILDGDKEVDQQTLIDSKEAGAMSFKYRPIGNNEIKEFYIPPKLDNRCELLPTTGIALDNNGITLRNPIPLGLEALVIEEGVLVGVKSKPDLHLNVYSTPGYYHIKWQTPVFLRNFILFFFASMLILSSFITVWGFIKQPNRKRK
ncbi:MAG: hypothetical protein V1661_02455 [bacterium]